MRRPWRLHAPRSLPFRLGPAIALIDAKNARSLRVAEKLGMTYEAETELFGTPVDRYFKGSSQSA